jgi:hypothetical protein
VSVSAITLCVASQWVFIVVSVSFIMTQSRNFQIHPHISNKPTHSVYPMHTRGSFPWTKAVKSAKLTAHLHLGPKLRMCGVSPLNPCMSPWYGSYAKGKIFFYFI